MKVLKSHTGSDSTIASITEMILARKARPYKDGDIIQDSKHPDATVDVTTETHDAGYDMLIVYSYPL